MMESSLVMEDNWQNDTYTYANVTEETVFGTALDLLNRCLKLLKITLEIHPLSLTDITTIVSKNDSLSYCLKSVSQFPSGTQPFILPIWQQVVWIIIFAGMISIAVVGNSIVIWIVTAHKTMRNITNFFLVNLSISDLLMAVLNAIFNFIFMLSSDWPFGYSYCRISNVIGTLSVSASAFTIAAISMERYRAIMRPLAPKITKKKAIVSVVLIWSLSLILSIPNALYSDVKSYMYPDGTMRTVCSLRWPDGLGIGVSTMDYRYNIIIMVVTYVIPVTALIISYSWMAQVLWRSGIIGENTDAQRASIRSKQRIARMLTVVAILFSVCWLPYHSYFIYVYHNQGVTETSGQSIQHIYLGIYWIAMSHATYNPIIYYRMNAKFQRYFGNVLCCKQKAFRRRRQDMQYTVMTVLRNFSGVGSFWSQKSVLAVAPAMSEQHQAVRDDLLDPAK